MIYIHLATIGHSCNVCIEVLCLGRQKKKVPDAPVVRVRILDAWGTPSEGQMSRWDCADRTDTRKNEEEDMDSRKRCCHRRPVVVSG